LRTVEDSSLFSLADGSSEMDDEKVLAEQAERLIATIKAIYPPGANLHQYLRAPEGGDPLSDAVVIGELVDQLDILAQSARWGERHLGGIVFGTTPDSRQKVYG